MTAVFDGAKAFQMKATHGLTLDIVIDHVIVKSKLIISWDNYIKEARANKRFDYQTLQEIEVGLSDAGIDKAIVQETIQRAKLWILQNPLEL